MPPTVAPKKPIPTPATPTPPVDPLANVAQRLEAETARAKAAHLATYRAAVNTLAAGGTIAAEEEQPLAAALAYFELDTDALKRDTSTVRTIESMKKNLGTTLEERAAKDTQLWGAVKVSATALDRLRDELKQAEIRHYQLAGASNGYGMACGELNRLLASNPRIFSPSWPLPPKPDAPTATHVNPLPMSPPPPPPPPVTEIYHPLLGKMVPITPELHKKLSDPTPAANGTLQEQAETDRKIAERRAAIGKKAEPVAFFDPSTADE